jgi:hypothetical protein
MSPEIIFQIVAGLISSVAVGVGVYAGIKSDLAVTHQIADTAAKSASRAHERIDSMMEK